MAGNSVNYSLSLKTTKERMFTTMDVIYLGGFAATYGGTKLYNYMYDQKMDPFVNAIMWPWTLTLVFVDAYVTPLMA